MKKIVNSYDECESYYGMDRVNLTTEDLAALKYGRIVNFDVSEEEYSVALKYVPDQPAVVCSEYINKEEFTDTVERSICRWCQKYKGGEWSNACALCKVSQVFQCIALATPYLFSPTDEIGIYVGKEPNHE